MSFTRRTLLAGAAATPFVSLASAQTRDPSWPANVTLGTASVGGTYFVYGQAWASLVGEKIGLQINTQQTQGPNQNLLLVQGKQIDLGMTTMGVALQAWHGRGDWTRGQQMRDVRALFPMYDTPFHFAVLKRSGITKVADLAGKRVGVGPRAGTPGTYFPLIFQALGVQNVTIRNGQASDMGSQLGDGLIDCFAFAAGLPIAAYTELANTQDMVFFGFNDGELEKLKAAMPELSPSTIPAGTYKQMASADKTIGLFNFAITNKGLPDSLAYAIVKAVHENHDAMVKGHAAASETIPQNVAKNAFLPFHPGAARYYREKGLTIPDNLVG
ncbi:TAXI family TRAP transporter solute-binding subunit [Phreatobacter sp.]|uniref:TAXI family TRAP transporter solute-binding subunit n=1 Tax=Phreatobacter sp. TaxID=1966341 RepID=UPI003F70463C